MNINIYNIKDYQIFIPLAGQKNKPNSNPILSAVGGFRKAKIACQKIRPFQQTKKIFWTIPNEVVRIKFLDKLSISDLC
jgi:hypothetical protein